MANEQSAEQPETQRDVREEPGEEQGETGATEAPEGAAGGEQGAAGDDPQAEIERLRAELEQAEARADQNWQRVLRTEAEKDNIRKRAQKDVDSARKQAVEKMANELLGDVVGNLLTNAIEHTEGPVEVRVSVETDDERVRIAIDDDGPGVDRTDDESIFERGERGDGSSGSGFGLYFVGAMVDSYGGDVWVEASDRGGALFVVELDRPPGRLPESH